LFNVTQHKVAISIGKCRFDAGLDVEPCPPSRIFLWHRSRAQVKRSPLPSGWHRTEVLNTRDVLAPIHVLQHALFINSKNISNLPCVQNEYLALPQKLDR